MDFTRCASVLAQCYVATDRDSVDPGLLEQAVADLNALPGRPGYVTETFCERSRFFQPVNGARIDAVRHAIATKHAGSALEPVLLTSLLEAADRVDSTTGVQMAYVKQWADRSFRPLELRVPLLLPGPGRAVRGDATVVAAELGDFDLAYLDPPYNQHRYEANYHIWETLVAWDAPDHYGVACKRTEVRQGERSVFNSRRTMPGSPGRCRARRAGPRPRALLQRRVMDGPRRADRDRVVSGGTWRCWRSRPTATWGPGSGSTTPPASGWGRSGGSGISSTCWSPGSAPRFATWSSPGATVWWWQGRVDRGRRSAPCSLLDPFVQPCQRGLLSGAGPCGRPRCFVG